MIYYDAPNYNSKLNLLLFLLAKKEAFKKVLIFVDQKRIADRLFEALELNFGNEYRKDNLSSTFALLKDESILNEPDAYQNQMENSQQISTYLASLDAEISFYDCFPGGEKFITKAIMLR